MQVIGFISEHYLRRYNLKESARFWREADSKDLVLLFFLAFYRCPGLFLLGEVILLGVIFGSAYRHSSAGALYPVLLGPQDTLSLAVLAWYGALILLLLAVVVQLARRRWSYSQLLLPRLLGASVVGTSVLLLDDLPWIMGIRCNLVNWLLVALCMYVGSFVYISMEIYNTTKFVRDWTMKEALRSSLQVFLIAWSETLFLVAVASGLILPLVDLTGTHRGDSLGILFCTNLVPGWWGDCLSLGFYPALVLLWTGVSLFVGSFAQLLWADSEITAPV
jgi:hypothetical protein